MTVVLWLLSILALFFTVVWFSISKGAIHEATAMVLLLIAAVLLVGASITGAINSGFKKLLEQQEKETKE